MMGLRKMLLILKEQNHIYSWNLLPEAFTVGLCVLSSSALRVLRRRGTPFSHVWFICRGKCLSASDFQTSPRHLGMGWEDVSLTSSPDWETMEECKKKKKKGVQKSPGCYRNPKVRQIPAGLGMFNALSYKPSAPWGFWLPEHSFLVWGTLLTCRLVGYNALNAVSGEHGQVTHFPARLLLRPTSSWLPRWHASGLILMFAKAPRLRVSACGNSMLLKPEIKNKK